MRERANSAEAFRANRSFVSIGGITAFQFRSIVQSDPRINRQPQ